MDNSADASMYAQKYIGENDGGLDDFDREYGLGQLLPASFLQKGAPHLNQLALDATFILNAEGEVYFEYCSLNESDKDALKNAIEDCPMEGRYLDLGASTIHLFPLSHEAEVIGFLGIGPSRPGTEPVERLILSILQEFMSMNQQILMTMGLHGKVVEDSYAALEKRNILLAESEQKYRNLAASLEKEVELKAEKIRKTQEILLMQEKMASIGQLAAGVAHEINNPMGFISSNLNSLRDYGADFRRLITGYRDLVRAIEDNLSKGQTPNQVLEKMEAVARAEKDLDADFLLEDILSIVDESMDGADRIKKIVQDLKDFAHPEKHEVQYSNLNRIMDSTLNIVQNEIKYKTEVLREYGDLEDLPCYPQQIGQVFMNLLVNAAQAMESCGEIIVKTYMEKGFAVVEISDNGKGIEPEHLSRIFDPFFTTKDVGQGTGLGLNVAYKIITRHKGNMFVTSEPGQGACFVIKLPLAASES